MKIRTDFVTNSSSSSFVAITIENEKLADLLKEYDEEFFGYPGMGNEVSFGIEDDDIEIDHTELDVDGNDVVSTIKKIISVNGRYRYDSDYKKQKEKLFRYLNKHSKEINNATKRFDYINVHSITDDVGSRYCHIMFDNGVVTSYIINESDVPSEKRGEFNENLHVFTGQKQETKAQDELAEQLGNKNIINTEIKSDKSYPYEEHVKKLIDNCSEEEQYYILNYLNKQGAKIGSRPEDIRKRLCDGYFLLKEFGNLSKDETGNLYFKQLQQAREQYKVYLKQSSQLKTSTTFNFDEKKVRIMMDNYANARDVLTYVVSEGGTAYFYGECSDDYVVADMSNMRFITPSTFVERTKIIRSDDVLDKVFPIKYEQGNLLTIDFEDNIFVFDGLLPLEKIITSNIIVDRGGLVKTSPSSKTRYYVAKASVYKEKSSSMYQKVQKLNNKGSNIGLITFEDFMFSFGKGNEQIKEPVLPQEEFSFSNKHVISVADGHYPTNRMMEYCGGIIDNNYSEDTDIVIIENVSQLKQIVFDYPALLEKKTVITYDCFIDYMLKKLKG